MKKLLLILQCVLFVCVVNPIFGQNKLEAFDDFIEPVGNWVKASEVKLDGYNPEKLVFQSGNDCFVNGVDGKAKYLISKEEYEDFAFHLDFMLPEGSNSGIYFHCRYEIQLFDSWGATDLTYYDCGGIQARWDDNRPEGEKAFDGYAPKVNASKFPGSWQELHVIFRAPKFNAEGEKIKNAVFEKVFINGILVQQNAELSGPTRGALSDEEVAEAPFRLQGGHGPVAFRNIVVTPLPSID